MEKAGAIVGGPAGAALAGIGATSAFAVAKLDELFTRVDNQNVRVSDVVAAAAAVESFLYTVGVYGTAVGSTVVVAPEALVGGLIVAVGVAALYHQNPTASLDAFETFLNTFDTSKPWIAAASAAKAYSKEVARQKNVEANSNLIISLQNRFDQALHTISPLILDLDGLNGAETLSKTAGVHFDHDGNKFFEQTGWVGQNDGLLVWDRNGNGQIDNGAELFGNNTVLQNGKKAANGFAALAELDANKDKKIDSADAAFANLRIFKDANSNGVVDSGELLTLNEAGVQSLNTGYTSQGVTDASGNQHLQAGSFTTMAGQSRAMDDVWFAVDTARTIATDLVAVNSTIAALPDMAGFGNVHSLHQAMARDGSGKLQGLVQSFQNSVNEASRRKLFDQILWTWTGADQYAATSRGPSIDARQLYTLEAFVGQGFVAVWGGPTGPYAAVYLADAYALLSNSLYVQLMGQTVYKPLYESIGLQWDDSAQTFTLDVQATVVMLKARYDADPAQGQAMIAGFADHLATLGETGALIAARLQQQGHIQGQGFDLYLATMGRSPVMGTPGVDTVKAKAGMNNLFSTGKGDDTLYGGAGDEIYQWSKGDGNDRIVEVAAVDVAIDTLQLLDVNASEVRLSRDRANLYITIGAEQIKVVDHFGGMPAALERLQFGDGSIWQRAMLDAAPYLGGAGSDKLNGSNQSETFLGGKGSDKLNGGTGADTYLWSKGDGDDVISEEGDLSTVADTLKLLDTKASEVRLSRDQTSLYVIVENEKIKITNHFSDPYASLEQIWFSDGTSWQKATLDAAFYLGTSANDTVYGGSEAEVFNTGKGADVLYGGAGGDTYSWLKGDGNDTINDVGAATDIDTLKLADAKAADVQLSRDAMNLYVTIGTEKITIKDHFASYMAAPIEQILFADGGKWQKTDLDAALYRGGTGSDTIYGTDSSESFLGGKGADTLYGGFGGDIYSWLKGDGNDTINDVGAATDIDTLKLVDAKAADVQLSRDAMNLYVTIGTEKITIKDHFASYMAAPIEQILFADGDKWLKAGLDLAPYRGTAAKNTIYGTAQAETFIAGAGADTLLGGAGNDIYLLDRGDGADTIQENDSTAGNTDVLQFMAGINSDQLWFRKASNNLEVSIIGTADKAVVKDWYLGNAYHVEQIKSGDGKLLQDTQVDKLVQAMAAFTAPAMGQTSLTAAQQTALAPVLAASWH